MGHQGPGFAFDNESPSHLALIQGVDIRVALVTNDEYLQFMRRRISAPFALACGRLGLGKRLNPCADVLAARP